EHESQPSGLVGRPTGGDVLAHLAVDPDRHFVAWSVPKLGHPGAVLGVPVGEPRVHRLRDRRVLAHDDEYRRHVVAPTSLTEMLLPPGQRLAPSCGEGDDW